MKLFVFGLGYSALAVISRAKEWEASGAARSAEAIATLRARGIAAFRFDDLKRDEGIAAALATADILIVSAPPGPDGDPTLAAFGADIAAAPTLKRMLYLSTVGVYGDWEGQWVDETSETRAAGPRLRARLAAEARWREIGAARGVPIDILRLAGIYGPGRNALAKLKAGEARRIVKPGQVFNRIHVEDIAGVALRLIEARGPGGILNVADGAPAPPQDVIAYGAELLGVPPPPEEPFATADLSPMARSFYADNRRISIEKLRHEVGYELAYPSYRQGLRALWEAGEGR